MVNRQDQQTHKRAGSAALLGFAGQLVGGRGSLVRAPLVGPAARGPGVGDGPGPAPTGTRVPIDRGPFGR